MRLARTPRSAAPFITQLIFTVLFAGFFFVVSVEMWLHAHPVVLAFLAVFDIVAIGLLIDVALRSWRMIVEREPVVEIDRNVVAYGEPALLKVTEPHPQLVAEMDVKLVGECSVTEAVEFSQHRHSTTNMTRCYEEELLRITPQNDKPVKLQMRMPKSPPADGVAWKIVVNSRQKNGAVVEYPFPLRVREH